MSAEFEALVRAHQGAVCATAYAVLRDRARSEEVAQDAFLIACRKLPALSPPPPLPAWICGIARNLARNAARKRSEIAMDAPPDRPGATTPLDEALAREEHAIASRALAELSEGDREIVVLYYRGDHAGDASFRAIAAALGITEATARQRLHRCRERLRSAAAAVGDVVRATRPGPAFTAACVAALAAGAAPADAEAAPFAPPASSALPLAVGGVAVAALAVIVVAVSVPARSRPSAPGGGSAPATPAASEPATDTAAFTGSASPAASTGVLGRISARDRVAQLARLRAALASAAGSAVSPAREKVYDFAEVRLDDIAIPDPPPTGPLSKRTLRYAIKLVQPLLLECLEDPDVHGTLRVRLHLAGAPDTATIVDSVDIDGDPPLSTNAALVECVATTLETIQLAPMPAVEAWQVYYPFVL